MISIIPSISKQDIDKAMKDSGILDKLKKYKGATFDISSVLSDIEKCTLWYSNNVYLTYVLGLHGFTITATESSHYSVVDISRERTTILAPSEIMGFVIGRKGKNIEKFKTKHNLKSVYVKVLNNPEYHNGGAKTILEICSLLDKCKDVRVELEARNNGRLFDLSKTPGFGRHYNDGNLIDMSDLPRYERRYGEDCFKVKLN